MHDELDMLTASDGASALVGFGLGAMPRAGACRALAFDHPVTITRHDMHRPRRNAT